MITNVSVFLALTDATVKSVSVLRIRFRIEFFHNFLSNSMNSLNWIHSDVSMK